MAAAITLSTNLHGSRLPVEIRTTSLSLLKIVNAPGVVFLDPGTYIVKATLPAGQEIEHVVELKDQPLNVDLDLESGDLESAAYAASPRARALEADRGAAQLRMEAPMLGMRSDAPQTRAWMICFDANPLQRKVTPFPMQPKIERSTGTIASASIPAAPRPMFLQLIQPAKPVVNIALPVSDQAGCSLVIRREPDRFWIDPQLENPDAMMLLGYRENRALEHEAYKAEDLLRAKMADPIGAVIGCYSLLSFGKLDRLHDWTGNLMRWMPWLPDGAALRGEHLARLGDHAAAIDAFLKVEQRGLPIFTDGVTMVYERLRMYTQMKKLAWKKGQHEAAERLRDRIADFIGFIDFVQPITTFTGRDLTAPDDRKSAGQLSPKGAIPIHQAFV